MSFMRQEFADTVEPLGPPTWITIHWTAGGYEQVFDHYHFNVRGNGDVVQTLSVRQKGSHTWHRNGGNLGVSFCAMAPGCPVKPVQVDAMARLIAELMGMFKIPLGNVKDHVYWAKLDGYGPGSGDPETRIDITGTPEGQKIWETLMKRIPEIRQQLQSKTLTNSLVGKVL